MEAFVYCWRNKSNRMQYVGWHKGTVDDGYVCSSKVMLSEYRKDPELFERQIIAFGSVKEMMELEHAILDFLDAANNDLYYNLHNAGSFVNRKPLTTETKRRISVALKGRKLSKEHRAWISSFLAQRKRKPLSEESKAKIGASVRGKKRKPFTQEHKDKIRASLMGHAVSLETVAKLKLSAGRPRRFDTI